jgi:hypothetical protein
MENTDHISRELCILLMHTIQYEPWIPRMISIGA